MSLSDFGAVGGLLSPIVMVIGFLWMRRKESHIELSSEDRDLRNMLNAHLLDCAKKNGVMETEMKNQTKELSGLRGDVGSLQVQVRALATGTHSRIVKLENDNA